LVAGCNNPTGNNVAYSNDGKKWTPVTNIFVGGIVLSIVYNDIDTWVAIGSGIGYSKDGKKWTQASNIEVESVEYNGIDTWIAVGDNVTAHSKDGETWSTVQPSVEYASVIVYNGVDTWVVIGLGIGYSKNNGVSWEITWEKRQNFDVIDLAYNGIDTWVAVGIPAVAGPSILYSKDGALTWNKGTDIFLGGFGNSVAYNGVDTWVAVGYVNNLSVVAYSKDGINWTMGTGIQVGSEGPSIFVKIFTLK
jgi:hypothetical protein